MPSAGHPAGIGEMDPGHEGQVPPAQIQDQIDSRFGGTGWSFQLGCVSRTVNANRFTMSPGTAAEQQAKSSRR